jgi:hypothetical protein
MVVVLVDVVVFWYPYQLGFLVVFVIVVDAVVVVVVVLQVFTINGWATVPSLLRTSFWNIQLPLKYGW